MVFIQEHWQLPSTLSILFSTSLQDAVSHGVSAMNNNEFARGRPHGVVAIVWRSLNESLMQPEPPLSDTPRTV
jgi:hypothetical protein